MEHIFFIKEDFSLRSIVQEHCTKNVNIHLLVTRVTQTITESVDLGFEHFKLLQCSFHVKNVKKMYFRSFVFSIVIKFTDIIESFP